MARLTKTQKEFRKKMKELSASGELKDEFGNPIKVKYHSSFNARNIIIFIVFACIVFNYARPFIYSLPFFNSEAYNTAYEEDLNTSAPADSSYQYQISAYIQDMELAAKYSTDTGTLIKKYQSGEVYSITEISNIREKFNTLLPAVEDNPPGTEELKTKVIEVIDTNIALLNFLEKNLGLEKTNEAITQQNTLIEQKNTASANYTEAVKNTLLSAGISYWETETGIEYEYKEIY